MVAVCALLFVFHPDRSDRLSAPDRNEQMCDRLSARAVIVDRSDRET